MKKHLDLRMKFYHAAKMSHNRKPCGWSNMPAEVRHARSILCAETIQNGIIFNYHPGVFTDLAGLIKAGRIGLRGPKGKLPR